MRTKQQLTLVDISTMSGPSAVWTLGWRELKAIFALARTKSRFMMDEVGEEPREEASELLCCEKGFHSGLSAGEVVECESRRCLEGIRMDEGAERGVDGREQKRKIGEDKWERRCRCLFGVEFSSWSKYAGEARFLAAG
jgi:hypothetical protein